MASRAELRMQGAAVVGPGDFEFELAGDLEKQVLGTVGRYQLDADGKTLA